MHIKLNFFIISYHNMMDDKKFNPKPYLKYDEAGYGLTIAIPPYSDLTMAEIIKIQDAYHEVMKVCNNRFRKRIIHRDIFEP